MQKSDKNWQKFTNESTNVGFGRRQCDSRLALHFDGHRRRRAGLGFYPYQHLYGQMATKVHVRHQIQVPRQLYTSFGTNTHPHNHVHSTCILAILPWMYASRLCLQVSSETFEILSFEIRSFEIWTFEIRTFEIRTFEIWNHLDIWDPAFWDSDTWDPDFWDSDF